MKSLERFLINIFNTAHLNPFMQGKMRSRFLRLHKEGSLDQVLRRGVALLDDSAQAEIREWILSHQTVEGGFPDRGGKCDLYYTLFGFFVAEALGMDMAFPMLKIFVQHTAQQQDPTGIDLFSLAILHASLFPNDPEKDRFIRKIRKIMDDKKGMQNGYSLFLVVLSLIYLRDHAGAWQVLKSIGKGETKIGKPCPVVAAEQILGYMKSGLNGAIPEPFMPYYRGNGGFAALTGGPAPDLLSTAVALFTLQFMEYDLRLIRPECLNFVSGFYHDGGFRAATNDVKVDVEYTFYGLLALGALNSN